MKEMNSLTHSCMHSLASFAILAFSGRAIFMMRATGAKLRMLASEAAALLFVPLGVVCGGEAEECGDEDDMAVAAGLRVAQVRGGCEWLASDGQSSGSTQRRLNARLEGKEASSGDASTCRWERAARKSRGLGRARESIRTIGDWKPSILLLDFEFVPEALGLCVCAFSVHVCLVSVRRLSLHDHVVCLCIRLGLHGPL